MTITKGKAGGRGSSPSSPGKQRASEVVQFFGGALYHTKGPLTGRPFELAPWQRQDIVEPLFGTLLEDGRRQYRTAYIEIPRKNGKSELASGIALVLLFIDGEPGAEVLCLASDVEQARVVFDACSRLVVASPEINQAFHPIVYRDAIEYPETGSVLRVLSADEKGIHGRNPSGLVLDELHTFTTRKQREFYVGATTGMGARANPLTVMITTAGFDKASVAFDLHQYAAEVRSGIRDDPSFLSVYYGAAANADWTDRDVWKAANPALRGPAPFLSLEYLEAEFRQAAGMPTRQNAFRTFYLNQWVGQQDRFLDLHLWDASKGHGITEADLYGRTALGGIDLAAVDDLTVAALIAPCRDTEGAWDVFLRCYLPESALTHHRHADLYRQFKQDGWLTITRGETVDYRFLETDVAALAKRVNIRSVNIDARFQGIQTATQLSEGGLDVRQMPQTHAAFAAPMKELERLVKACHLHHGGNPILRWAIDHLVVDIDSNGDAKPSKRRAHEKIDPVVSLLMALELAIRNNQREPEYQVLIFGGRR